MFLSREFVDEKYRPCIDYLNSHYDYCYLDSMHYINENYDTQAIITGLSYGLVGVDAQKMRYTINFCMHSQDLYYDYLHARRAVLTGRGKIRKCYISLGYYSLFYDMSLSINKVRCSQIYGPLFEYYHHAEKIDREKSTEIESKKVEHYRRFAHEFFAGEPSYYGVAVTREAISEFYSIYEKEWWEVPGQDRDKMAAETAIKHNRHIKRKETFKENVGIMENYIRFLVQNDIMPIVIVTPFSMEYKSYILKEYKEILLHVLEMLPYRIEFMDMNDLDVFEPEDFLDMTHLNQKGAEKAADMLNKIFDNGYV